MAKHTKVHWTKKGDSGFSSPAIVTSSSSGGIHERVKSILSDGHQLSSEDRFILTQIHLICLFRQARDGWRKNKLSKYIIKREEKITEGEENKNPQINLTPEDFHNLNSWVVNQDLAGKLPNLLKRVKQKRREAKKKK